MHCAKGPGICGALILLAALGAAPVSASTLTVTNTNDGGPGSLRDAIASAASGDTIDFSLAYPATITLASTLTINTSLTITGPGASNVAISGNNLVQVLSIGAGNTVTISGVTIENGTSSVGKLAYSVNAYGGLYNAGTLTLNNSTISGNSANVGDLAYVVNASGGLYNVGTMTISNSTVSGNSATFTKDAYVANAYGGLYNSGTLTISNSTISGNSANIGDLGGSSVNGYAGLYNSGTLTISNSTISGNSASLGADEYYTNGYGGLYNAGTLALSNSTVSGNSANVGALPYNSNGYGGIYNAQTLTLSNSTVSGNSASVGALPSNSAGYGGISNGGKWTAKNNIIANNASGGNCSGTFISQGYNLSDDASCAASFTQTGDLNSTAAGLDPGGLKDNGGPTQTIALLSNSAAVDAVPLSPIYYCTDMSGNPIAFDQRGVIRPQGSACDIGAFELAQVQTSTLTQSVSFTTTAPASAIFVSTFPVAAQSTSGLTVMLSLNSASTSVCAIGTSSVAGGITSATVTMLSGTGSCTIFALQPGNVSYLPAALQQTTALALQISQVAVTVTGPASVTYGTSGTATATGGSGTGLVTFSAGASTGCSVTGTTVSVSNVAGTCSLTATKAADDDYNVATSAAFPVTLMQGSQVLLTVTGPASVTYGTTGTATATGGSGTGLVTFSAGASTGCSVTGTTVSVSNVAGTCSLTATNAGDGNYFATTSAAFPVTLLLGGQAISFATAAPSSAGYNSIFPVAAQSTSGLTVTFSVDSSSMSVCSLGTPSVAAGVTSATVTMMSGTGTCTIDANQAGGGGGFNPAAQQQTSATATKIDAFTYVTSLPNASNYGQSVTLTATAAAVPPGTGTPSGGTLTFMQGTTVLGTGSPLNLSTLPGSAQGWSPITTSGTAPGSLCNLPILGDGLGDLIFYGQPACSGPNQLWVLSSANGLGGTPTWTQLFPTGGTPAGRHAAMSVYDPTTNSMIIFGGCLGGCFPTGNDVWVLSHANGKGGTPAWTQLSPATSPAPRINSAVAYDPATNRMMIFGGQNGGGSACSTYNDTWVLTNANGTGGAANWTQLSPVGGPPAGQYGPTTFYDSANNRMTVTGGSGIVSGSCSTTNAVWVLSNANGLGGSPVWTNLIAQGDPTAPPNFGGVTTGVYDVANNRGLLQPQPPTNSVWGIINANGLGGPAAWANLNPSGGPAPAGIYGVVLDSTNNLLSSLHGDNTVWVMGTGVDPITAIYSGDSNFNATGADAGSTATPLPQTVNQVSQTISFTTTAPSTAAYNSTFPVAAQSTSGLTVTLSVDAVSTGVCSLGTSSVAGGVTSATVTMLNATGICSIDANQSGNGNYSAALQQQTSATAVLAGQTVSFTTTAPANAAYNSTFPVAAQSTSALTVSFSVDAVSTSVCSLGTPGVAGGVTSATVTMLSASGVCSIDANQSGNGNYAAAPQQQTSAAAILASQALLTVTGPASVTYGATGTATATGGSGTGLVSFSAGASTGCSVTGATVSVSNAAGTCSLTAAKAADNNYNAATSAAFSVTLVPEGGQAVSFKQAAPSTASYSSTFPVAAQSSSGLTVTLSVDSGSTSVCSLGTPSVVGGVTSVTVTMLSATGVCTIDGNQSGNSNYSAAAQQQTSATATMANQTLLTVTGPAILTFGTTGTATATGGSGTGLVSFSSGTSTGCSVTGTTVSVSNAAGTCSLTATKAADNNYSAAASAAFPATLLQASQALLTVTGPASVTYGTNGTATSTGGSGTGLVSFSAGASTGCSVTGTTVSVSNAVGTCSLTATRAADNNYSVANSATFPVTLVKAAATLTLSNLSQAYNGAPESATVTTNPNGLTAVSVTYTGTAGTVYGPTTTAPTNAGSYTADASLSNANYQASDAIGTLTITLTLVSIKLTPATPSILLGSTQQFTATGTYSDNSTQNITASANWTSATPSVATIGANSGLATGVSAGTSQVTAILGNVKSASDPLTVNNPAPLIGSLSPLHAPAGTAVTLTVNGSGFVSTSTVIFNGKTETTTFGSATQLTVAIPAADVSSGGAVNVTVTNPAPGGSTSTASNFTIDSFGVAGPGSSVNVTPGQPTPVTISIAPTSNGFADAIQLSVAGLPRGTTAQFSQNTVTPGSTTTKITLTVTATAGAALPTVPTGKNFPMGPMGLLAALLAAGLLVVRRRTSWGALLPARAAALALWLIVVGGLAASLGGCASVPGSGNSNATPPGSYTITVTGVSGTAQHSAAVTLNIE